MSLPVVAGKFLTRNNELALSLYQIIETHSIVDELYCSYDNVLVQSAIHPVVQPAQ